MEELEIDLASFSVSNEPNSVAAPHPRFAQYKTKQTASSQEERRRRFLEAQKLKRFDYVGHARALATNEWDTKEKADDEKLEEMDVDLLQKKPPRSYKNQLMLSEWLVEVPDDLVKNWFLVLCPIGKRSLVVASRGRTAAYSRSGYRLNTFPSNLPGGHKRHGERQANPYSLLDCIYCERSKTYYILDVICWNSHPLYDSEVEFRFYWIETKVRENLEVSEVSSTNPYRFVPLPYYTCEAETIKKVLESPLPFSSELDGLLFFHKEGHYMPGVASPLACWLKAYMVEEILNIKVPEQLCTDKPLTYTTMQNYVPKAFAKNQERKNKMETNGT